MYTSFNVLRAIGLLLLLLIIFEKLNVTKGEHHFPVAAFNFKNKVLLSSVATKVPLQISYNSPTADTLIFFSGMGELWDQKPKTNLFYWDKNFSELSSPKYLEGKFLISLGAFFSSEDRERFRSFRDPKDLNLPKDLLPESDFCLKQDSSSEIFRYTFISSYGDYWSIDSSLLKSQISNSNSDQIPQFLTYSWINKKSLLNLRWRKSFS